MNIFVSWSGDGSRQAAELMRDWLPNVLQGVQVWVSSQDIGKGDRWSAVLRDRLDEIQFGLLMVTNANHQAPWIMFEAGALSKALQSKLIPIPCDIDRIAIAPTPLGQFQSALVDKEELFGVVAAANGSRESPLEGGRLKAAFDKWWPEFRAAFDEIVFATAPAPAAAAAGDDIPARLSRIEGALDNLLQQQQANRANLTPLNDPVIRAASLKLLKGMLAPTAIKPGLSLGDLAIGVPSSAGRDIKTGLLNPDIQIGSKGNSPGETPKRSDRKPPQTDD